MGGACGRCRRVGSTVFFQADENQQEKCSCQFDDGLNVVRMVKVIEYKPHCH